MVGTDKKTFQVSVSNNRLKLKRALTRDRSNTTAFHNKRCNVTDRDQHLMQLVGDACRAGPQKMLAKIC